MILTSVRMEGVRCFADPVAVVLAKDRVNLVAGPNGSGKSTLIQAARRCLLDSHTSTAVSDLQPWADGRTPEITVEFEHGRVSYRLKKRFVKHKSATLEKKKGKAWTVVQEGKEADEAVREMLLSTGRNDDGIFGVLWSAQGALAMESVPKAVLENVRAGLGAQIGHLALEKRLQKLYEENFQPKRGEPKRGRLHEVRELQEKNRQAAEGARAALAQIDEEGRKAETARAELDALRTRIVERAPRIREAENLKARASELDRVVRELENTWSALQATHAAEQQKIAGIDGETGARDRLNAQVPELLATAEAAGKQEAATARRAEELRIESDKLAEPDPAERQAADRIELGERWLRLSATAGSLAERVDALRTIAAEAGNLQQELAGLRAPDKAAVAAVRNADQTLRQALLWLEKLELRVDLTAESAIEVEVTEGTPSGANRVALGGAFEARGTDALSLRIPGVAKLRFSGPETDAARWQGEAAAAREELTTLCAPYGTDRIDELDSLCERRLGLERRLARLGDDRARHLAGATLEKLESELESARRELDGLAAREPGWPAVPPDTADLRSQAAQLAQKRQEQQARVRRDWHDAAAAHTAASRACEQAKAAVETNRTQRESCELRLTRLREDGRTDQQRRSEAAELGRRMDSASADLTAARKEREQIPATALAEAEKLQEAQRMDEAAVAGLEKQVAAAESALRILLAQGAYSNLAEAEEELERLCREEAAEALRLEGIKRLWNAFQEEKAEALNGLSEPVARRATELLEEFAGRDFASLRLSQDFAQTTVTPTDADRVAELEELSGGEQEIVHVAVRLALAESVTREERHMVVLDDVLLNTDDQKLNRILAYLQTNLKRMQPVILTCHPERYAQLAEAKRIDFPPAAAAAAGA